MNKEQPSDLLSQVTSLDPAAKAALREALGATTAIAPPKRRRATNEDVRHVINAVGSQGDCTHEADFRPVPPEWLSALIWDGPHGTGNLVRPDLLEKFYAHFDAGKGMGRGDVEIIDDPEQFGLDSSALTF